MSAANALQKQLKELLKTPIPGFRVYLKDESNIFEWEIGIIGPPETIYEGGYFLVRFMHLKQGAIKISSRLSL